MLSNIYSLIHHDLQYYLYRCNPVIGENDATIAFEIPKRTRVKLTIYDILGIEMMVITDKTFNAGYFEVKVDCKNLPSGKYVYKLAAGHYFDEKNLFVIK